MVGSEKVNKRSFGRKLSSMPLSYLQRTCGSRLLLLLFFMVSVLTEGNRTPGKRAKKMSEILFARYLYGHLIVTKVMFRKTVNERKSNMVFIQK
ncbi:Conotoxin Lt16a [Trichinella pseudospiralis]